MSNEYNIKAYSDRKFMHINDLFVEARAWQKSEYKNDERDKQFTCFPRRCKLE